MNKSIQKQHNIQEIKSRQRYIPIVIILLLMLITVFIYILSSQEPVYDQASKKIILQAVAELLYEDPNDLTDEDLAMVVELSLEGKTLSDIKLLEKFTNLKDLNLSNINIPQTNVPTWMKVLAKLGIIDLSKRNSIDLSPLRNITSLQQLDFSYTQVRDLKPLKDLTNLQMLSGFFTDISDLRPLKGLDNLQILYLFLHLPAYFFRNAPWDIGFLKQAFDYVAPVKAFNDLPACPDFHSLK